MKALKIAAFFAAAILSSQNLWAAAFIAPSLERVMNDESRPETVVMVFLKEKANLTEAQNILTKEEKTRYVYDKLLEVAKSSQANLVKYLDSKNLFYRRFYITNAIAVYSPTRQHINEMAEMPEVRKLSLDPTIRRESEKRDLFMEKQARRGIEPALRSIGVDRIWSEFKVKGDGIIVASQDTGIDWDHPALIGKYRGYHGANHVEHDYNWHDAIIKRTNQSSQNSCGYATAAPCDDGEHGTHTLGTVVGEAGDNQIGLAPEAKWIACRNMDDGDGRPSLYIDCFQFFLAPHPVGGDPFEQGDPSKAADIINNSWGCPETEGCEGWEMEEVLKAMKAAGILVVVSAGNEGPGCGTMDDQPASHGLSVLSVGAYDHRMNRIASFSSRGPTSFDNQAGPDVVAPGVSIRSAVPGGGYAGGWSGTSMAGPHVAGVATLMWAANPALIGQIDQTIQIIRETATRKTTSQVCGNVRGDAIPNAVFGYGVVNAYEAVKRAVNQTR